MHIQTRIFIFGQFNVETYQRTKSSRMGFANLVGHALTDILDTDLKKTVLRIRDVYPGSWIRIFSIPDPGSSSYNLRQVF
jgi:hypothetical protein